MNLEDRVSIIKIKIDKFKKDYPEIFKPSYYDKLIWSYKENKFHAPEE